MESLTIQAPAQKRLALRKLIVFDTHHGSHGRDCCCRNGHPHLLDGDRDAFRVCVHRSWPAPNSDM